VPPPLPWPGLVVRFAQIQRVFGAVGVGSSRLRMSLKVHHIGLSSMNTSRKRVCLLQVVYAYLAKPQIPTGALSWTPTGGLPSPDPLCPPYLQTLATPLATTYDWLRGGVSVLSHRAAVLMASAGVARKLHTPAVPLAPDFPRRWGSAPVLSAIQGGGK